MSNKWFWMMDWCYKNKLAPANNKVWCLAEEAYLQYNKENKNLV